MKNTRGHFTPNGLKVGLLPKALDYQTWSLVENRGAELLMHLQPSLLTLQTRYEVVCYLKRLLTTRCKISCEVFEVGSVLFKTYLPHGDIDLATFTSNKDCEALIDEVWNLLKIQEKRHDNYKFRVKSIQYIPAEVKILKFAIDNFIVDLSFNQRGGLCTLCFLDEVDNVIGQNHLFKRSVILIKAWCYFESRTLGACYRLMSTYALETLVIYIFHLYNKPFAGPLEVLFRFLEFFNRFDWDNYCLSLWGPVHKDSLPNLMRGSAMTIKSAMASGEEKLLRLVECAQDKGPRMLPPPSSSSAELSLNHPLPPPRMQNVGPFYGPISGINNHNQNSNKVGTGTFIPDPAKYKSGINFHGRKRNYERGREGRRFNFEYVRTHHGNNAQIFQNNHNQRNENPVWRPIRTKPSMNIRNHNNGQFNASTSSSVTAPAAGLMKKAQPLDED
ncbi:hypothetical protein PIB30_014656 [Stylosanthes scabra]|uniref:Polymerase nucleotidyl transferase domain-containing protein n=1 Tax=Stylosanthes scabra TaxID=79078 RepID=A0ABU6T8Q4_9FABA|nr:hypothetical protein [Stylosanthes scabra]